MGLYYKTSIVLFYIPVIAIYLIYKIYIKQKSKKFNILSIKRYLRYIKIYLNSQVIFLIIIISIISNTIINLQNNEYKKIYNTLSKQEKVNLTGVIISEKQEKQYYYKYKIEAKYNNKKIRFYITTSKSEKLGYGDKITFSGTYKKPESQRNYKGFDYAQYLKQLKIYGTIKCEKLKIISKNQTNKIFKISNEISNKIIENTQKILDDKTSSILLGLTLGYKEDIDEETRENFANASMSHILAISGMHITYVILGINIIFKNLIGKRKTIYLNICILIFYMLITNFSPSITRAGIMGIIMLFSKIVYRKSDFCTSISISLFLILIYNPFLIQNLGLQLSYGGVVGIFIFNKSIIKMLKNIKIKNKIYRYKIKPKIQKSLDKIKEIISISLSVQIFILPIIIYNLNTFNPYFLIASLILSILIGPIVILCFLFIIIVLVNQHIAVLFIKLVQIIIHILRLISLIGELPNAKIYIATPNFIMIMFYYLFFGVIFFIYNIYSSKNPNKSQMRVRNLIALIKLKVRRHRKLVNIIILFSVVILLIANFTPKNLRIYFIDVGQGDSSLIITPQNKTILIDGGGSVNSDFDVGKSTLIPYILDRGFTKIDIVIISHFDNDHVGGLLTLFEELKVKKVYISKQIEASKNYDKFLSLTEEKNIKVYEVTSGSRLHIEKNLYFDILWPNEKQISTNVLNNNSIVCNLHYRKFSMLFTGDIEEIAENEIVQLYSKNKNLLKADILKVAHHGSKSSSSEQFLSLVMPKVAVIGVGTGNSFGHPNLEILQRLESLKCRVFRTDLCGEIFIDVNRFGRISYNFNSNMKH